MLKACAQLSVETLKLIAQIIVCSCAMAPRVIKIYLLILWQFTIGNPETAAMAHARLKDMFSTFKTNVSRAKINA